MNIYLENMGRPKTPRENYQIKKLHKSDPIINMKKIII